MRKELQALEDNSTWEIVDLPSHKKAIDSKWIYKVKYKRDGLVEHYKARLVTKGYNQLLGLDYTASFSPVAKTVTIRILLALVSTRNWVIHQLDINNAYLNGVINEEIYMKPPNGYPAPKIGQVCKLKKSLYGLKQVGRQWNKELTSKLLSFGFT